MSRLFMARSCLTALALWVVPASAQTAPAAGEAVKSGVLSGKVVLAPRAKPPVPGGLLTVNVVLEIDAGWHIYANPAGDETVRPTVVGVDPKAPVRILGVDYPPGAPLGALGSNPPVLVYEPTVTIPLRLQLKDDVPAGPLVVPIIVKFQPCDDRACLAPATLKLNAKLDVQSR